MTYIPKRDDRFEYLWEAMTHLEEQQCETCVFRRTDDPEYPMCFDISGKFIQEEPIDEIDDQGDRGLFCTLYKQGDPTPDQTDGQIALDIEN